MAVNIPSISSIPTTAIGLANLILVSPQSTVGYQPQGLPNKDGTLGPQPPTLIFHYEGEQSVSLQSDITDHFIEDNTAINDQISLKPEIVTTNGFIGELNDVAPFGLQTLKNLADKLVPIQAYQPVLSATAINAYNQAAFLYSVAANTLDSAVSAWNSLPIVGGGNNTNIAGTNFNPATGSVSGTQNKQQIAFQQFYGYWRERRLFKVQTPWAIFQNMAIQSLRSVQDADTKVITDFEITFKVLRFAQTTTNFLPLGVSNFQQRLNQMAAANVNNGTNPALVDASLLSKL